MDISLEKKFDRKSIHEIKAKIEIFSYNFKVISNTLTWYFVCENLRSRPEIVFIYVISTNLADMDFIKKLVSEEEI